MNLDCRYLILFGIVLIVLALVLWGCKTAKPKKRKIQCAPKCDEEKKEEQKCYHKGFKGGCKPIQQDDELVLAKNAYYKNQVRRFQKRKALCTAPWLKREGAGVNVSDESIYNMLPSGVVPFVFFSGSSLAGNYYTSLSNVDRIALLVGIDYIGDPTAHLPTCFHDITTMGSFLQSNAGYPSSGTYWLSDNMGLLPNGSTSATGPRALMCTLQQFYATWKIIVERAKQNHQNGRRTELLFYYSGHGSHAPSIDWDQVDGEDECLLLLNEPWWDRDIQQCFRELPSSCRAFFIPDACHSGTNARLPWAVNMINFGLDQQTHYTDMDAHVIEFSGCLPPQTSDAGLTSKELSAHIEVLLEIWNWALTNRRPLSALEMLCRCRQRLLAKHHRQIPMLSFSHKEDLHARIF